MYTCCIGQEGLVAMKEAKLKLESKCNQTKITEVQNGVGSVRLDLEAQYGHEFAEVLPLKPTRV